MVSTMHRLSGALQPLKSRMIRHRQAPVPLGFAPGSRHHLHPSGAENVGLCSRAHDGICLCRRADMSRISSLSGALLACK